MLPPPPNFFPSSPTNLFITKKPWSLGNWARPTKASHLLILLLYRLHWGGRTCFRKETLFTHWLQRKENENISERKQGQENQKKPRGKGRRRQPRPSVLGPHPLGPSRARVLKLACIEGPPWVSKPGARKK